MIKVLEKSVADKIAAGEVIERPVSIVKELVENAVDSGADSIIVEITHGGKKYIRVTDNGCGIPSDEVETAFLRHATSKITTAKDLNAIETLGFRGEALASIAAVTHTELITKTKDSKTGVKVLIHGSQVISNSATGCPDGTTIIITDLFYNTPARLKFLKSDSAESSQIIDFMSQVSLAYPDIKFRFINNGNIVFSTNGMGDLHSTILSVYKLKEYKDLISVDFTDENSNRVYGYISKPSLSRTSRRNQTFFVNGRVVSSKVMEKGVTEGYKERLFDGRYPVCFLFVATNPAGLDVNIHPNKREVRFDNESDIIKLVSTAIKIALGTEEAVIDVKSPFIVKESAEIKKESGKEEQVDIKKLLSTMDRGTEIVAEKPASSTAGRPTVADAEKSTEAATEKPAEAIAKGPEKFTVESPAEELAVRDYVVPFGKSSSGETEATENAVAEKSTPEKSRPAIEITAPALKPFDFNNLKPTGAIFNTYITAVDHDDFYLIDQHAAHERIFYEKLVGEYMADEKLSQPILTPIITEVSLATKENQYDWLDGLKEMGFLIEPFGQNSYVIKEIPTFMTIGEAESFVEEYIESIENGTKLNNTVVINKLITKSCKSAVKAHDLLTMEEITALIDQLKACRNPFSCPHGRPTFVKITKYQIERMFLRA